MTTLPFDCVSQSGYFEEKWNQPTESATESCSGAGSDSNLVPGTSPDWWFSRFSSVPPSKCCDTGLKLKHNRCIPSPLQFIIRQVPYHLMLRNTTYWHRRDTSHKQNTVQKWSLYSAGYIPGTIICNPLPYGHTPCRPTLQQMHWTVHPDTSQTARRLWNTVRQSASFVCSPCLKLARRHHFISLNAVFKWLNTPASYLDCPGFISRPGNLLSWLTFLSPSLN